VKKVDKAWGLETWLTNREYCAKYLDIKPGWRCSVHRHKNKDETFVVVKGACFLEIGGVEHIAREDDGKEYHISPLTWHWFGVPKQWGPCRMLEISTHHEDEDCERRIPSRHFDE